MEEKGKVGQTIINARHNSLLVGGFCLRNKLSMFFFWQSMSQFFKAELIMDKACSETTIGSLGTSLEIADIKKSCRIHPHKEHSPNTNKEHEHCNKIVTAILFTFRM